MSSLGTFRQGVFDESDAHHLCPRGLDCDLSHCLVLAPATLAALPSTRAIPHRDVFYVAHPIRSIQRR